MSRYTHPLAVFAVALAFACQENRAGVAGRNRPAEVGVEDARVCSQGGIVLPPAHFQAVLVDQTSLSSAYGSKSHITEMLVSQTQVNLMTHFPKFARRILTVIYVQKGKSCLSIHLQSD
jgi:hypothetical protein